MPATSTKTSPVELQTVTRILLALWDMGDVKTAVKRKELTQRIVSGKQKVADYEPLLAQLGQDNVRAIVVEKAGNSKTYTLTEEGKELLRQHLKNPEVIFSSSAGTGAKTVNALLKWIREMSETAPTTDTNGKVSRGAIASYEDFKLEILNVFLELDKEYNYSGLVPIWHLRQAVGGRVTRAKFNEWMMQLQAEQVFYLQTGEGTGATEDQKRNSIESEIRGLLFYASQPS